MNKDYLFVAGCPRSGTSILALILGSHHEICIGIERFSKHVIPKFKMKKELYDKERFFDFRPDDTFLDFSRHQNLFDYHEMLKQRWENAKYVGDKIPVLFDFYDKMIEEFDDDGKLKIVFIYRNVYDVLNSYQAKIVNDPNWNKTFERGLKNWNESLFKSIQLKKEGFSICPVEYENLFFADNTHELEALFEFLDLEITEAVQKRFERSKKRAYELEEERVKNNYLGVNEKRKIMSTAKTIFYNRIKEV